MLSFIANLDEDRLRQVQARTDQITSADLCQGLVDDWLTHEEWRARHRGSAPSLTTQERLDAATRLAVALWGAPRPPRRRR
jgi:hypothetical protein